jgi:hypothetical protein
MSLAFLKRIFLRDERICSTNRVLYQKKRRRSNKNKKKCPSALAAKSSPAWQNVFVGVFVGRGEYRRKMEDGTEVISKIKMQKSKLRNRCATV